MPAEMRRTLHLKGLIPASIEDFAKQEARAYEQLQSKGTNLDKYIFLANLRSININLFYRLVLSHLREVAPLIYTPTVGEACIKYSHIYPFLYPCKESVGLFITIHDVESIDEVLSNYKETISQELVPEISVITDGSRILGLGDLGINGMGIPIGKLQLYVAAAGLNPGRCLPIILDFGTDTKDAAPDDKTFYEATEKVITALHKAFPNMLIQFEDFSTDHAFELLEGWRNKILCFNDDIQGTGCVILAGFINAVKNAGISPKNQRILWIEYFIYEHQVPEEQAKAMFWFVDSRGMITANRGDKLADHKVYFARHDNGDVQCKDLEEAIEYIKPTALIGLSTIYKIRTARSFSRCQTLQIKAECSFEEAMIYTNNRVLFASGTAFPTYTVPETGIRHVPGQGNNIQPKCITDTMIFAVAKALANSLTDEERARGELYPRIERIRDVSAELASAFITQAVREDQVREKYWHKVASIACGEAKDVIPDGKYPEKMLEEVKVLMWSPAASVEQYICDAMASLK
ncbi:Aminoacid dehydrogenase-like protein [Linderina pennispora]|uniref:Malic enzyme n=1 Tax=Linderina pennispora TaxID=61395 RepID=A0A1Y1W6Y2_9FUNG|nr:Aminoacid dehydrogenase-like protein [Linderina pennispora]ORX68924.1 Aminoacid dehydrogenase-like protein [Linderina pennispora]